MKKIISLLLNVTMVLILSGCVLDSGEDKVEFFLKGSSVINMTTVDNYSEPGFTAKDGETDISSYVTVTGSVTSREAGTFLIQYKLDYETTKITLVRAVIVVDSDLIADPDELLYDGTCANVEIHYIDLGSMGDSTLIDCGDFEILIDAGLKSAGTEVIVPYLQTYVTDGVLEMIITTHPDADHIGGFVGLSDQDGIFDAFTVERVLDYGYTKDTTTHTQYAQLREASRAIICSGSEALAGINLCQPYYTITNNLVLRVIDTGNYNGQDTNNDNENSIVVMLEHGDLKYLFTGDAEWEAEEHMAATIGNIDVYKAGHHGSKTANSQIFLTALQPKDIILGVYFPDDDDGENGYGIPQQESLNIMFGITDNIYATGVSGHIVITSNGTTYTIVGQLNSTLLKDSVWFSTHRIYP